MANKKIVILPCAGSSHRFAGKVPKQYALINGKTILEHTLATFLSLTQIDQIIIVTAPNDKYIDTLLPKHILASPNYLDKVQILKVGGASRAHSVKNGLAVLNCNADDWILVHDVARCCITSNEIVRMLDMLQDDLVGGILATVATDTIKQSKTGLIISQTLERNMIYQAQTPQMFRFSVLHEALDISDLTLVTDEASAVEQINLPVKIVRGESANIKVTYPLDIKLAEVILNSRK